MKPTVPPAAYPEQSATAPGDAALLARMRAGDETALGALYDRWQGPVRALAFRITGDDMEADDVVEEVFWQAWRQADRYDSARGSAGTWLLTVARSRSLDRVRSARRARTDASLD
jgi:RNA polymerase sigma-70 factor (ECF subfamily)